MRSEFMIGRSFYLKTMYDDLFGVLNNIACYKGLGRLNKDLSYTEKAKKPPIFMINKWLSMDNSTLKSVAESQINSNKHLTVNQQLCMLFHSIDGVDYFNPSYLKPKKKR